MEKKQQFTQKEKYTGDFKGMEVSFNREWSGYRFSDEECEALLSGAEIMIRPKSKKTGKEYDCYGQLKEQEYNGKTFYGFVPDFETKRVPSQFLGHLFSDKEKKDLEKGKELLLIDLVSKAGKTFSAKVSFDKKDGLKMTFDNKE